MAADDHGQVYARWLALWNGDLALAAALISPAFTLHQVGVSGPLDADQFRGPDGLVRLIQMSRAPFADLRFHLEVGPVAAGPMLAARWTGQGTYQGGLLGATAAAGTPVTFGGNDILRLEGGMVAEYWVSSDGLSLMAQLGAIPTSLVPPAPE